MENSTNRKNDYLGVNKVGKNIRKSPLHQPNFANDAARQQSQPPPPPQSQPQVYNISKSDFRDIVQQLTGSPSHSQERPPRPAQNSPKPQSMRLQKIRPPPLPGVNRPHSPCPMPVHVARQPLPQSNMLARPPVQFGQPSTTNVQSLAPPGNSVFAESPVSAYMRYLQHSMLNPSPIGGQQPTQQPQPHSLSQPQPQPHPQPQPQPQPYMQPQPQSHIQLQSHGQTQFPNNIRGQQPPSTFLPNPSVSGFPSPRMSSPVPPFNGTFQPVPSLLSPQINVPSFLPSPTSQFLLPSPNGYANLLSPRSPYPLLSPGTLFPPLTPTFPFSPTAQSGIFGLGSQPPLSPGLPFPLSPAGFFPLPSPGWRDQ